MKESALERDSKKLARLLRWVAYKGVSRPGGADHIFLRGGVGFCVEFKVGKNKQQVNQKNEEQILRESEVPYFVVRSLEEFADILEQMGRRRVVQ